MLERTHDILEPIQNLSTLEALVIHSISTLANRKKNRIKAYGAVVQLMTSFIAELPPMFFIMPIHRSISEKV